MTDLDRWLSKVDKNQNGGCWIWIGAKFSGKNRGQFWFRGTNWNAARAGWTLLRGAIPVRKMLCHHCDNEICVNPEHLYIGDQSANMRDRNVRNRTSRWDKRYNFKQAPSTEFCAILLRESGDTVSEICKSLGIGRSTYYRMARRGVIDKDMTRRIAKDNYRRAAARR